MVVIDTYNKAIDDAVKKLHEVLQFHFMIHIVLQSKYCNRRFNWTYPDEDFMKTCKATPLDRSTPYIHHIRK